MTPENQHSSDTPKPEGKTRLRIRFIEAVSIEFPVRLLEHGPLRMEQTEARPFLSTARVFQQM